MTTSSSGIAVTKLPPGSTALDIEAITPAGRETRSDYVTVEEPLEIRLCHGPDRRELTLSITMRTPGHDEELAVGFLFGEGIIQGARDVQNVGHCGPPSPDKGLHNVIKVELAEGVVFDPAALDRHFYTTSSCGVCGKTSIDAVRVRIPKRAESADFRVSARTLAKVPGTLRSQQAEFERTGGLHASGLFDSNGGLTFLREDVGRHNALDKVVGAKVLAGETPLTSVGLILSGRASFELVQKAAMSGIRFVAAVGSPSSLAVELAHEEEITLVGFLRADRCNVYTHPQRLTD